MASILIGQFRLLRKLLPKWVYMYSDSTPVSWPICLHVPHSGLKNTVKTQRQRGSHVPGTRGRIYLLGRLNHGSQDSIIFEQGRSSGPLRKQNLPLSSQDIQKYLSQTSPVHSKSTIRQLVSCIFFKQQFMEAPKGNQFQHLIQSLHCTERTYFCNCFLLLSFTKHWTEVQTDFILFKKIHLHNMRERERRHNLGGGGKEGKTETPANSPLGVELRQGWLSGPQDQYLSWN